MVMSIKGNGLRTKHMGMASTSMQKELLIKGTGSKTSKKELVRSSGQITLTTKAAT